MSAYLSTRRVPPRSQLTAMAHLVGLDHADTLSSTELLEKLSDDHGFPRLQRMLKRHERRKRKQKKRKRARERSDTVVRSPNKHRRFDEQDRGAVSPSGKSSAAQKKSHVAVDPILLCPLPDDPKKRFSYARPNGLIVEYSCESLADYLLCSGQFREPETRLPFSDSDLRRLDEQIRLLGLRSEFCLRDSNTLLTCTLKLRTIC